MQGLAPCPQPHGIRGWGQGCITPAVNAFAGTCTPEPDAPKDWPRCSGGRVAVGAGRRRRCVVARAHRTAVQGVAGGGGRAASPRGVSRSLWFWGVWTRWHHQTGRLSRKMSVTQRQAQLRGGLVHCNTGGPGQTLPNASLGCIGKGGGWGWGWGSEGEGRGGGGFGWDPPSSHGPPVVRAEGGPKILKLQSSWHRRH